MSRKILCSCNFSNSIIVHSSLHLKFIQVNVLQCRSGFLISSYPSGRRFCVTTRTIIILSFSEQIIISNFSFTSSAPAALHSFQTLFPESFCFVITGTCLIDQPSVFIRRISFGNRIIWYLSNMSCDQNDPIWLKSEIRLRDARYVLFGSNPAVAHRGSISSDRLKRLQRSTLCFIPGLLTVPWSFYVSPCQI